METNVGRALARRFLQITTLFVSGRGPTYEIENSCEASHQNAVVNSDGVFMFALCQFFTSPLLSLNRTQNTANQRRKLLLLILVKSSRYFNAMDLVVFLPAATP